MGAALAGAANTGQIQDVPRTYSPAAPLTTDTAAANGTVRDRQQFANPSVLSMGPNKDLVVRYEQMPRFGVSSSTQVTSLGDFTTKASKNAWLSIKSYITA